MIDHPRRLLGIVAGIVASGVLASPTPVRGADESSLPASVSQAITELAERNHAARIVKQDGEPWIVAVGRGRASPKAVPGMERDNATRAAVVAAKSEVATMIDANIDTFTKTWTSARGETITTRDVKVTVGVVLSRVELHNARYNASTQECRVVIICPPLGKDGQFGHLYPDTRSAANALLKKTGDGLCHHGGGVILIKLNGHDGGKPKLVAIAITAGPASGGGREISRVKGLAALQQFLKERIKSEVTLHSESTIADPLHPDGSRHFYSEELKEVISINGAGALPPTVAESIEAGDVVYTATWFADDDRDAKRRATP